METKNLLTQIKTAIANRKPSPTDKWLLMFKNDSILCVPARGYPHKGRLIKKINLDEAINGFSPAEWTKIARQVFLLIERKNKCQHPQKPLL